MFLNKEDSSCYKFDDQGHTVIYEDDGYRYHAECPRRIKDVLMYKAIKKQNEAKIWQFSLRKL